MKPAAPPPPLTDAQLEQALTNSRALQDAPEELILRAVALWRNQAAAQPANPASTGLVIQRLLAALRFDSRATSVMALGLRSAAATETRQLLFSAEGYDIDLRIKPVNIADGKGAWEVRGQVFGPSAGGSVELTSVDGTIVQSWDELGEFCFESVRSGQWQVVLHGPSVEVKTPPFDLGFVGDSTWRPAD